MAQRIEEYFLALVVMRYQARQIIKHSTIISGHKNKHIVADTLQYVSCGNVDFVVPVDVVVPVIRSSQIFHVTSAYVKTCHFCQQMVASLSRLVLRTLRARSSMSAGHFISEGNKDLIMQ